MIITTQYSGDRKKIEKYLENWNIDHASYIIIIKDSWLNSIKLFDRKIKISVSKLLFFYRDYITSKMIYYKLK